MSSKAGNRKRRRESPSYEDYLGGEKEPPETSSGGRYTKTGDSERSRSPLNKESQFSFPRRYHARSQYNDTRRESDEEQERLLRRQRSASPRQENLSHRTSSPPFLFKDSTLSFTHRLTRSSPPPKRAEPTDDYLWTSREHSRRLDDPTQSRKLIVLDLNGSLLIRSPHVRRSGRGTQQPRLRAVHPRPFIPAFRSYIFHKETKPWLDVMVWSSAQPHSVDDMVDKCFQERKKELRAIWARDTLGLNQDEYHRKTQTFKDLEKPWANLDESSEGLTRHSALTTVLIDDSPLKAALQPWNHLCIKEYLANLRTSDLSVASWEAAKRRLQEAREVLECEIRQKEEQKQKEEEEAELRRQEDEKLTNDAIRNPANTKVIREVAMVKGKIVGEEHVIKKLSKEVVMVEGKMVGEHEDDGSLADDNDDKLSAKNRKRKKKRLAKKEAIVKVKEEIENESAKEEEIEEGEIDHSELEQQHETEELKLQSLAPKMKYDETLLAVIGVLDHLKHESSVAGWMRHGGLLNVEAAEDAFRLSKNSDGPPRKRRRLSSSPAKPSSQSDIHSPSPPASPSHRVEERDEQAHTGVPLMPSDTSKDTPPPPSLWFERPAVMSYWADRGRLALEELDIPVESGVTAY